MSDKTAFEGTAVQDGLPSNLSADPVHRRWLLDQALELFDFFQPNLINPAGGFYALAQDGTPLTCQGQAGLTQHLHNTTRMVHCFALGQVLGIVGADAVIDHGMAHIWHRHRDAQQ
ncbi:MAG: AGE family epimerase/isomerase, partial [Rhodobacterales bacterium]